MHKKAFTLIELLIVIIIIGILATIAIPQYQKMVRRAKISGAIPKLKQIIDAEQVYYMEYGAYFLVNVCSPADAAKWQIIGIDIPNDTNFNFGFWTYPCGITIVDKLGSTAAHALPYPYITGAWGNPDYYEVGLSVDGKLGVVDTNQNLEIWNQ